MIPSSGWNVRTCVAVHTGCLAPGLRVVAIQLGPRKPPRAIGLTETAHIRLEGHEIPLGGNGALREMPAAVKCAGFDHVIALALVANESSVAATLAVTNRVRPITPPKTSVAPQGCGSGARMVRCQQAWAVRVRPMPTVGCGSRDIGQLALSAPAQEWCGQACGQSSTAGHWT